MSKLERLIQQYCPDGVEWKTIGEVCVVLTGGEAPDDAIKGKEPFGDCIYPIYSNGVGENALWGYASSYKIEKVSVTFSSIGTIGYPTIRKGYYTPIIRLKVIYPQDDSQLSVYYLKYALETVEFEKQRSSVPNINANMIKAISIPLPPLPVQEEIVRILDTFTELQAELQAELQKRQQQYNYYRDNLLSFEGRTDVQWKKLGKIASITTGRRFVRTDIRESGVPCFHYGDIYTYYGLTATKTKGYLDDELAKKLRFAQPNDVVVVCAGENDMDIGVGVAWLGDEPAVVHDACCILHHNQSSRYISHFLRTHNYHLQMKKYVKNGKISSLPASGLAEALIPLPSLEEQERIASILDRFDTLTNDLTSGLPAEMEKRRQQYEYYRDRLLTFKRL